jgi:hypothetical protein
MSGSQANGSQADSERRQRQLDELELLTNAAPSQQRHQ